MKIIRFLEKSRVAFGVLDGDFVKEILNFNFSKNIKLLNKKYHINDVKILAPSLPKKVIGLAYNYKDLVGEKSSYEDPLVFMKSPTSVIGIDDFIKIPKNKKVWVEVELVIIASDKINDKNATLSEKILGFTIGNDVTVESKYRRDHHLAQSKARDTFAPIGPFIETDLDTTNLKLMNKINGEIFQEGNTSKRIFKDEESLELVESIMTLEPGDLIFTGTPANAENSIVRSGDQCELFVEGLGKLTNKVI
tara:strand:- start:77 stop:826 length:750 start_codon:yes stop_codon:yes gene_type:complete